MITKITNTPIFTSVYKYQNRSLNNQNTEPQNDAVSFTSKNSLTKDIVDFAFNKLAQTRSGKNLGNYAGTIGNTNYHIRETKLGKNAELSIAKRNEFANFEISRSTDKPAEIKYQENDLSSNALAAAVTKILNK